MTAPGSTAPLAVTRTDAPLPPGATIGVFGGGQLGRMLGIAARRLGYRFAVYSDDHDGPASHVADRSVQASYEDEAALEAFARSVDAVTFEFENVPSVAGEIAARHCPVRPRGGLLHTVQNRQREKDGLVGIGLPVATFAPVRTADELRAAAEAIPGAGVLKTASFGYDGKGQVKVAGAHELEGAWASLGRADAVLETLVPFEREVSVVARARRRRQHRDLRAVPERPRQSHPRRHDLPRRAARRAAREDRRDRARGPRRPRRGGGPVHRAVPPPGR